MFQDVVQFCVIIGNMLFEPLKKLIVIHIAWESVILYV